MKINIAGHTMRLLPQKAIWEPENKYLIISDCHLGKVEHFRASGIGLPINAIDDTINKLKSLLQTFEPNHVIFLGDLFHSIKNESFEKLKILIANHKIIDFSLIVGNHDIMNKDDYSTRGLSVYDEMFYGNLWLTHEPQAEVRHGLYNLAGHIHPGIRLKGTAKQSISLPCFYFGQNTGILPAFGYFTGKHLIKADKKSRIFAISENNIYNVSSPA